ncbi:hypothetical protein RND81_07G015300 [Saponaria officinalis]|uniref:Fe2OG dioxygenase domain-containing protein n=1 Tax=Saponaria officinalis TaxID=3572 RepID=A0AAW1JLV1_SAPOF
MWLPAFGDSAVDLLSTTADDHNDDGESDGGGWCWWWVIVVINHGVPIELMDKTVEIIEQLFKLPPEEKAKLKMENDINSVFKMYTSTLNMEEHTQSWRDAFRLNCDSLETNLRFWPQTPKRFRDIVSEYFTLVKELGSKLLQCLSEGLGLEPEYLKSQFNKVHGLVANYYPACPDPSLTIGIPSHEDPTFITIIRPSNVPGLQIRKDGEWWSVETPSNAFVVLLGNQIEVISNGKLKAVEHRVVSATEARTSLVLNIFPSDDCIIGPAKALIEANERELYKTFRYKEFYDSLIVKRLLSNSPYVIVNE